MEAEIQEKINQKTKPLGSLGRLEAIALQVAKVQKSLSPQFSKPTIVVFTGDHGLAKEAVSAYPQEVTYQMVLNFLHGGAAINVFCKANGLDLTVVDCGVIGEFSETAGLLHAKIAHGTNNSLHEPAMTSEQYQRAWQSGEKIVKDLFRSGCNLVGFGEMGIGNTSAASLIMSDLCGIPIEECYGSGTGVVGDALQHKLKILQQVQEKHGRQGESSKSLQIFGGFEIVQMSAAMLTAYECGMTLLIDGFISTVAYLAAYEMQERLADNAIFSHVSGESGHRKLLNYLQAEPLLDLQLRLGEGSACAVAYPIVRNSLDFFNGMASFASAGVSQ
ncbi:MAG: nicotinate-nucleotide--dimethylbenzimidazole phosphoribosyltransferase [Spirochaetota bacterium]